MIEGTAHIPVCMKESQRLKIQHGFPKTPSFQGKLLGLTPCQVVLECILLHMHWSQLLFFQPNSQGKIYESNQFPFFLHSVEMLLLYVHENRQLADSSNFATTFGLFSRDFRHPMSLCPPRRY